MISFFQKKRPLIKYYSNADLRQKVWMNQMLPTPMSENVPNWFRKLKADASTGSLKTCPSFINMMKTGFVIKTPSEITVEGIVENGRVEAEIKPTAPKEIAILETHDHEQFSADFPFHQRHINMALKFTNPFRCRTSEPVDVLFLPCWWDVNNENVTAFHGMFRLPSDRDIPLNVNCAFRMPNAGEKYVVPYGTPIAHIIFVEQASVQFKHDPSLRDDDQANWSIAQVGLVQAQGSMRKFAENMKRFLVK